MASGRLSLEEVVGSWDHLMGVKAVYGRSISSVMCFGSHGDEQKKDNGHFSLAKKTAEKAVTQPFILAVGGGRQIAKELRGLVLELTRATGVYGDTAAFVEDQAHVTLLAQWPVAVVISETYRIVDEPHIVKDLGFPDLSILSQAFDSVLRRDADIPKLWEALKDKTLERRWDVLPPAGFIDPKKVDFRWNSYPRTEGAQPEGQRRWALSLQIERNGALRQQAIEQNRATNHGDIVCCACAFRDTMSALFDAHHPLPLAAGERQSRADDLVILCPRCHRWAHHKAADKTIPIPISELVEQVRNLTA